MGVACVRTHRNGTDALGGKKSGRGEGVHGINLFGKYRRFYQPGKNIGGGEGGRLIDSPSFFRPFLSPSPFDLFEFIGRERECWNDVSRVVN